MNKSYSELITLKTFSERFQYLQVLGQEIGFTTFGQYRYLNQQFYTGYEWRKLRNDIIVRDNSCDLGIEGRDIFGLIRIHHINPITIDQMKNHDPIILDPENLISCSLNTHNAIHYGEEPVHDIAQRSQYDTCPWKGGLNGT